jgi:hypothetical protein
MGMVEDILKVLDRLPGWKRLQEVPSEVDELKSRVAALEEKLGGKWPPDVCALCGARAARMGHRHVDERGTVAERWDCEDCKNSDWRYHKLSAKP